MKQIGTMSSGVTLRGLRGSSLLVSPLRRAFRPELYSSLKASITLLGAGTIGAYILFKLFPKLSAGNSPSPDSIREATTEGPVEHILTVPGLQNTGNNCFLNVILQALASSEVLLKFMDACAALTTETDYKSQGRRGCEKVAMPLAIEVSSLIKDLSQLDSVQRTSSPRRVMLALSLYVQHFDLASQQDAAEALIHLASALQEERGKYLEWLRPTLQSFVKAPVLRDANFNIGSRNGSYSLKGGDQLLDSWRGQLPWPLEGTIASSLTCQRCGYQFSTQFQSFNDITLTPLCDREGKMIRGCSLESCLDHFTRSEWVESVKCSNCSHKAALVSIFLNSDNSIVSAITSGRTGNYKVSRSKVKYIEECGCDEDCKCEALTVEEGAVWRNIYTNACKQLKIGRSPQVICFQIQRVVMSQVGGIKKLTGHVTFPSVLDLFPYTVAGKGSIPLRGHVSKKINQDSSFPKDRLSRLSHSSFTTERVSVNKPSLLHSGLSCKGGADLGQPADEELKTIDSDGKDGCREESSVIRPEAGSEEMGSTYIDASPSLSDLDRIHEGEKGIESLSTEPVNESGPRSKEVEDSALPSFTVDLAIQDVPQKDYPVDNPSIVVAGTNHSKIEELTAKNNFTTCIKQTSSSDELLVNEQITNQHCEPVEEFQSIQHCALKNGGISTSTSNIVQSIYSQYTPQLFPPILQQLSSFAKPDDGEKLSAGVYCNVKKLPGLHSMPKKTTTLMHKDPKYSRELLYQLVSVVVHQGGPQTGHYLVYRKVRIHGSKIKCNPTHEDLAHSKEPMGEKGDSEKGAAISADNVPDPCEQFPVKLSPAEGGKVQADVSQLFEVESLPDITSSGPPSRRFQVSDVQELCKCELLHDVSWADKLRAERTCGAVLEDGTMGICGRQEDADSLWFRISDTNVQRVHEQEVFSAQASLLFYEQL